jgi:hypothetical protein
MVNHYPAEGATSFQESVFDGQLNFIMDLFDLQFRLHVKQARLKEHKIYF